MKGKCALAFAIGMFFLLAAPFAAVAADEKWPTRPITVYVGYAPGGGVDMTARLLSEGMRKSLGVGMPTVNMMGANSAIAMEHVSKQPKDGYTLFGMSNSVCTFPATGLSNLTYREFGLIGIAFGSMPTFCVPQDSPLKSAKDLIDRLKKGGLTGSNNGIGGAWHLPQLVIVNALGGSYKAVPYDGGAPAALAAAKKEVDFSTSDLSEALTLIKAKMIRPLFVFDDKPYIWEDGGMPPIPPVTDFIPAIKNRVQAAKAWRALSYQRGIPQDRVNKLIDTFRASMNTEAVKNFAKKNLLPIDGRTGAEADKMFEEATRVQSWLLFDIKEAKRSPQEVGIQKP